MDNDTPKRILVVDDDRSLRSLLSLVIEEEGYEVVEAQNGEDCLRQFTRIPPDLVLLDAVMPDMDGFTCCEQLRSLPSGQETPILMVTFLDDQESIEKAFAVGATDYLTKPIHWAVLLQRLKRLIYSSQATRELEDLRKWQEILTSLLELLSEPVLGQEGLAEIFLKIQDYFQVDRVLIEANDNANSLLIIVNNSQDRKKYSPEIISILSLLEAQSSLILTTLKPSPAYFIIASNEQREWQPKEIDRFTQIALLLSYHSPQ